MLKDLELHTPETCLQTTSIVEVARHLRDKRIRQLFVVDKEGAPLGVIAATDIVFKLVAEGKDGNDLNAEDIMSRPVDCAELTQEVEFAMKIMMERKTYSCLVTENGKAKGVVSYKDVMERIVEKLHSGN